MKTAETSKYSRCRIGYTRGTTELFTLSTYLTAHTYTSTRLCDDILTRAISCFSNAMLNAMRLGMIYRRGFMPKRYLESDKPDKLSLSMVKLDLHGVKHHP